MKFRKRQRGVPRRARRNARLKVRLGVSTLCLCLLAGALAGLLAACGVQVGSGNTPYISENNVGPQSPRYQMLVQGHESPREAMSIIETARQQIGVRYRLGGASPERGFDCSGLIFWVYKQNGLSVPRVARAQSNFGSPVDKNLLAPGDIVAFRVGGAYHTGIYSGNGYFIHSPKQGDRVREESLDTAYWQRHFIGARRVH